MADDLSVCKGNHGEVYTFTVDGLNVYLRDNHLRTTDWLAFALPSGAVKSVAAVQHLQGDVLEAQYVDGSGILWSRFSLDDGAHWSDPVRQTP